MRFHQAWAWAAVAGVIVLTAVSLFVEERVLRTLLALASVTPVLYATEQLTKTYRRRVVQERRKFSRLRRATDDFIMSVRNLNRLKVLVQEGDAPEDTHGLIEQVVQRMRETVDRIVEAAGVEDPRPGPGAGSS